MVRAGALALLLVVGLAVPAPAGAKPTYVPAEVIVGFRGGTPADERRQARSATRTAHKRRLLVPDAALLTVERGQSVEGAVAALERRPDVAYAQPNFLRELAATSATPDDRHYLAGTLWGLHNTGQLVGSSSGTPDADIDAPEAWTIERGSPATIVGVVDSGLMRDHPDIRDNLFANQGELGTDAGGNPKQGNGVDDDGNGKVDDWQGWDFLAGDNDPQDLHSHGTHVAGTIAAQGNNGIGTAGVAQDAAILPVRVTGARGVGTDADITDGFRYAAQMGARVVNSSLGSSPYAAPVYEAAMAASPRTLFVVAAGNEALDVETGPYAPCGSDAPNVMCVAATDKTDTLASFSNRGATRVDVAAPGTEILSPVPKVTGYLARDDFETAMPYTTGGTNSTWERLDLQTAGWWLGSNRGGSYANHADAWVERTGPFDLTGLERCEMGFTALMNLEPGYDKLLVEATEGVGAGATWDRVKELTTSQIEHHENRMVGADLSRYNGVPHLRLRLRLVTNGAVTADGVLIDDVTVRCLEVTTGSFLGFKEGTSMAAPHVAGVAALLFSKVPGASPSTVRAAIEAGADHKPRLDGRVAGGRRLNAYGALMALSPHGTVSLAGETLSFDAAPGAANRLTVSRSGSTYTFADAGSPVKAGAGCAPLGANKVTCSPTSVSALSISLRDGTDSLASSAPVATTVDGGPGNDTLATGASSDTVVGGEGVDTVTYASRSTPVSVSLDGIRNDGGTEDGAAVSARDNVMADVENLVGGAGADRLTGSAADNVLDGGRGGDDLSGRSGVDRVSYAARTTPVVVDVDGLKDDGGAEDGAAPADRDNVRNDVENVTGGRGADALTGSTGANVIDGGAGGDAIAGGGGADTVSYASRTEAVTVDLDGVRDDGSSVDAAAVGDRDNVMADVENVAGGLGSDTLTGSATANTIDGGRGGDAIAGGGGTDTVSYASRTAAVTVDLDGVRDDGGSLDATAVGDRDNVMADVENILGGSGADTLTGSSARNLIDGGRGGDVIAGGAGSDTVSYATRAVAVTVDLDGVKDDGSAEDGTATTARDNVLVDVENVTGGSGNDTLTAIAPNAVINLLTGGAGDDRLTTRDGTGTADKLACGAGADSYDADPADVPSLCEAAATLP